MPHRRASLTSGCVGANCSPGSQAAIVNSTGDAIVADIGGPGAGTFAAGFAACVYYRPTSNLVASSFYPIFNLFDAGVSERLTFAAGNGDNLTSWPTLTSLVTQVGFGDVTATYTATTTNPWAACVYSPDGTGETGGTRLWLYERVSGAWTERVDISGVHSVAAAATDAVVVLMNYDPGDLSFGFTPTRTYYAWIRSEWNGVNYDSATAQTNITDLLGCSVNPSDSDFRNIWPFTETSTSAETDLRGNTNLAFTSIGRATGDALWTGHGSGASAECDP